MSVQHELAMAIGNHIELDGMLRYFIKVCMQRLGLVSAHVYLYQNHQGWPETREKVAPGIDSPGHYLSVPMQTRGQPWANVDLLRHFDPEELLEQPSYCKRQRGHFYTFPVAQHGVFVLQPQQRLDPTIIAALRPIFARLANSCRACISHDGLLREMRARQEAERSLQHQLFYDPVTNLPNRKQLVKTIAHEKFQPKINSLKKSLLCIEIENYRRITNILGYEFGTKIQLRFAQILRNLTREKDVVSQLDANVFVVMIDQDAEKAQDLHELSQRLVDRVQASIGEPLLIGSHPVQLTIRSGFEVYPIFYCDADQVISHAEIAKSESVINGSKVATAYSQAIQDQVDNRLRMESALKSAVKNDELSLWWQPQYSASQQLVGAEALLRWISDEWGFVSPGVFIPLAEESDLIEKIGDWVMHKACEQLADICALGLPAHFQKLAINVSARQLAHNAFVDKLIHLIGAYKIPRGLLAIELTESTLVQNFDQTVALIRQLKQAGVDCSIDDFGTGYSSLSYLKHLPIQTIKIDQSFVRDIHQSAGDQAIAKTLIYLGKNLHKDIIAEGVETAEERDCLIEMGCKQFQGYFYDKPQPLDDLKSRWYQDGLRFANSA